MYFAVYMYGKGDNEVYGVWISLLSPKIVHSIKMFWHDNSKVVEDIKSDPNMECKVFKCDDLNRVVNSVTDIVEEYKWQEVTDIDNVIEQVLHEV